MSAQPPTGWLVVPLGEVADVQLGKMLDQKRTDGTRLPYLRNVNVRWGHFEVSDLLEMPFKDHELERYAVRPGDVLVCEGGEPGRAATWRRSDLTLKYQKALHRVRLGGDLPPSWLVHQLYLDASSGRLGKSFTGTTIGHLPREAFIEYEFRLAPFPEQHRIVEAIESYFTRLDDAVATLDRVLRNLTRFRASVLKAAVEGRLVPTEAQLARAERRDYEPASVLLEHIMVDRRRRWEASGRKGKYQEPVAPDTTSLSKLPEGWCLATVEQIAEHRLGKMLDKDKNQGTPRPYLRNANVRWFEFDLEDVSEMRVKETELDEVSVHAGDVVVCEGGEPGRAAVWQRADQSFVIQKALHRVRPAQGISPWFFAYLLAADAASGRLSGGFTGSTIKHFTGEALRKYCVPIPPQREQQRIVEAVDDVLSLIVAAEKILDAAQRRCARLRQSILKWAFEGKLADQDPSDEPASILLECIKAERAAATPTKERRSKGRLRETA